MPVFKQYLRPNGETRFMKIKRPEPMEALALEVVEKGGKFEIEVLSTGVVSMECGIELSDNWRTLAMELCHNGPELFAAVDKLIRAAHAALEAK